MSKPWPNAENNDAPTSDEMFNYVNEVWKEYSSFMAWEAIYARHCNAVIEVMADTGATIMGAAGALYVLGLQENDEGPERWLAVGFEMFRRYRIAEKQITELYPGHELGQTFINANGELQRV